MSESNHKYELIRRLRDYDTNLFWHLDIQIYDFEQIRKIPVSNTISATLQFFAKYLWGWLNKNDVAEVMRQYFMTHGLNWYIIHSMLWEDEFSLKYQGPALECYTQGNTLGNKFPEFSYILSEFDDYCLYTAAHTKKPVYTIHNALNSQIIRQWERLFLPCFSLDWNSIITLYNPIY